MASRKTSKKKIEIETLTSEEVKTLKPKNKIDTVAVDNMVSYIKENLADQLNGDGVPVFVNVQELHEQFNLTPSYSKKKDRNSMNRHVNRVLHKMDNPIWCRYLSRDDKTRFVSFFNKIN